MHVCVGLLAVILVVSPLLLHQVHATASFCGKLDGMGREGGAASVGGEIELPEKLLGSGCRMQSRGGEWEWSSIRGKGSMGSVIEGAASADGQPEMCGDDSFGKQEFKVANTQSSEWLDSLFAAAHTAAARTLWRPPTFGVRTGNSGSSSSSGNGRPGAVPDSCSEPHLGTHHPSPAPLHSNACDISNDGTAAACVTGGDGCASLAAGATFSSIKPRPAPHAAPPTWCSSSWWRPSVYSYVQKRYWGVGLVKYWRVQQVG